MNAQLKMSAREELWIEQGGLCFWCGEPMHNDHTRKTHKDFATIEHVIPSSLGGRGSRHNLKLAHYACNTGRQRRVACPVAWIQRLTGLLHATRGYLDGLEIADEIDKTLEAMERLDKAVFEAIRKRPDQSRESP